MEKLVWRWGSGAGWGRTAATRDPWHQPRLLGCRGCCVCVAVEVFQGPLLEVNEQILAVAAGREQGLKCPFPRAFCPTATLCQSGYFCAMGITSMFS